MMEIQLGDIFKLGHGNYLYMVRSIGVTYIEVNVFYDNRIVGKCLEHRNTLLKMQKLSSLEKELM